jgi:prefoldin subunit 5
MILAGTGLQLMIEQTITVGNIIEIISIIGGGIAVFVTLKATVGNLKEQVVEMQAEIKKLADVITRMAVTDIRLTNLEMDVRELRHGRGFVQSAIDGEWPKPAR